jgi:hypothetical protein
VDRQFLDANILFSAAYRSDSGLRRLWDLDGIQLITSAYAIEEARRNLLDDAQRRRLDALLIPLEQVPEALGRRLPAGIELPEKDRAHSLRRTRRGRIAPDHRQRYALWQVFWPGGGGLTHPNAGRLLSLH